MKRHLVFTLMLISGFSMISHAQLDQGFIQSFGSSGFSEDSEYIAMDSEENIWMTGEFNASWSPPSGPGARSFSTSGLRDTYIMKLDLNGETHWCQALQNTYDSWMTGIAVDSEDNVLITGAFRGTMDFNPSPTEEFRIGAGTSNWHGFILKLDKNGDFLWATKFGTTGSSWHVYARDIIVDNEDNIIIAGTFANPMKFGSVELSSVGPSTFVIKANKNGSAIWGTKLQDYSVDSRGRVLSLSPDNGIYLSTNTHIHRINNSTGAIEGSLGGNDRGTTVDSDATGAFALKLRDRTDTFAGKSTITKYQFPWGFSWANDYDEALFYEFRVTPFGLFAYGVVSSGNNVMPSNQDTFIYEGPQGKAGLIQKIDPYTGNVVKNTFFPTDNTMGFNGMTFNKDKVIMCGTYHGSTCLDFNNPSDKRNGGNFGTSFIMDWTDCLAETSIINQWSCKPLEINNSTVNESGRYYTSDFNEEGCLLITAIDLEVELFDKIVLSDGDKIYVTDQEYDLQWYDCLNKQILPNETEYEFIPNDDRPYAVILENQGCIDTSNCTSLKDFSFDADDVKSDYEFGKRISISGDWAAISTANSNKTVSGFVYIFKRENNKWVQKKKIAPDTRSNWDYFGDALSLFDNRLAIGAWNDDTKARDGGKVYLYKLEGDEWVFDQAVFGHDLDQNDRFGKSVALHYDMLIVGATGKNSNNNNSIQSKEGAVYVFKPSGKTPTGDWEQSQKLIQSPKHAQSNFGWQIRIEEDYAYIAAPYGRNNDNSNIGIILQYKIQDDNRLILNNRITYPNDAGLGTDFDISGDKLLAVTDNYILYYKKEGNKWSFQEELIPATDILDNAIVRVDGNYAAYTEATYRSYGSNVKMIHFENGEWKPYNDFENGGDIDTHVSAFDMENYYLLMGATENSLHHERGGRVFTHYYRFNLTPVKNINIPSIAVYPSPTKGLLNIDYNKEIKTIKIYDLMGRSWNLGTSLVLDVSFLNGGLHFLVLEDKEGNLFKGKFVKM